MINNLYSIGQSALQNAQLSIENASNNIANAGTTGYQRTDTVYESNSSITVNGITVGTGASVTSISSSWDQYIESQYLDAAADLASENEAYTYLYQLDYLFDSDEETGISATLSSFFSAWNDLASDPDSESAREALLGEAETLTYALNSATESLSDLVDSINDEISDMVDEANDLIAQIAAANEYLAANSDDTTAVSERDELIRELNDIVGVEVTYSDDNTVTVQTEEGYTLVDGTETHDLVYASARATESLKRDSEYEGSISYSGTSSEEILIEFVSEGADGTAQFKVSTDGGETWLTDENGDTALYTADGEDNSVTIEGVTIWFEDGGTSEHSVGDRYTIVAKSGLYYEASDGDLVNITPLTDDEGNEASDRVSSGGLAGLFETRDDTIAEAQEALDDLAEALIWEVNSLHSQGAGTEHHDVLTGSYSVDDPTDLASNSGLTYADEIESGSLTLSIYDEDGDVYSTAVVSFDADTDSLQDLADEITSASGGLVTASFNSDGELVLAGTGDYTFEIVEDETNVLAALGVNTFFSGDDAESISVNSTVSNDASYISAAAVDQDDYGVSSGNNDIAEALTSLGDETITIGDDETTLTQAISTLVSSIGTAVENSELQLTYAETAADYLYEEQASVSEVNVDDELIALMKYQQAYQAAAEIITITQSLMDTTLDLV